MFQKIHTLEIDGKIIKLQIVSAAVCAYCQNSLSQFFLTVNWYPFPILFWFELHILLNITTGVTALLVSQFDLSVVPSVATAFGLWYESVQFVLLQCPFA